MLLAAAALLHPPACSASSKRLTGGSLKLQGRVELALSDDLLYWELEGPILRADPRVAWMSGRILSASLLVEGAEVFVFFAAAALEAPGSEGVGMMWSRNLNDWQFNTSQTSGRHRPGGAAVAATTGGAGRAVVRHAADGAGPAAAPAGGAELGAVAGLVRAQARTRALGGGQIERGGGDQGGGGEFR